MTEVNVFAYIVYTLPIYTETRLGGLMPPLKRTTYF